ncbi:MAG: hypothetical protein EOP04_12745 [Proteobacteria bacterium]|nr:MAG: hypothetical protein EOP04_12745 [Pseudomonadota bacterium]
MREGSATQAKKAKSATSPREVQLITDHSMLLTELKTIDGDKLPETYIELKLFIVDRMASAERFVSPYYEEICDRLLSRTASWLINESGWSAGKVLQFAGDVCAALQNNERDSNSISDSFIKTLSFSAYDHDALKSQILQFESDPTQDWLANMQGTMIALDINRLYGLEDRIKAIKDIPDKPARSYAESSVLNRMALESVEQAQTFFLSDDSLCVRDHLLLDRLFPDTDEDSLNKILKSKNALHRDWALASLVLNKFDLNNSAGVNFLIAQIQDEDLRNDAIRSLGSAQSRRKQLKDVSPNNAPPGVFE